ncbi:MAG: hypothetical protein LBJ36_05705 [Synergistaceae bacterium]|jgi:hypothetical protein|nr:hypothetical protein [Synergistaceae bacterium]
MLGNEHEVFGESPNNDNFNCWQSLKPKTPQREDEIYLGVKVTKVEKSLRIESRRKPKIQATMGLQQPSLE